MENLLKIIGVPSSIIIVTSTIIAISIALEKISSPAARKDLAHYIVTTDFPAASIKLPYAIKELFEKIFGAAHLSGKCFTHSAAISFGAIAVLLVLGFLTHYSYFRTMPSFIADHPGFRIKYFGYICWSLVVDYINLYKTRLIIVFVTRRRISFSVLFLISVVDVFLSYALFTSFYFFFECINMGYQLVHMGVINGSQFLPTVAWIFRVNIFEELIIRPSTLSFILRGPTSNEIAVLFYAGLVPSVWLWLLTISLFIMSAVIKGKWIIQACIYFLNVEERPILSLGVVAAASIGGIWLLVYVARLAI